MTINILTNYGLFSDLSSFLCLIDIVEEVWATYWGKKQREFEIQA